MSSFCFLVGLYACFLSRYNYKVYNPCLSRQTRKNIFRLISRIGHAPLNQPRCNDGEHTLEPVTGRHWLLIRGHRRKRQHLTLPVT